jgi:hypothetical protein
MGGWPCGSGSGTPLTAASAAADGGGSSDPTAALGGGSVTPPQALAACSIHDPVQHYQQNHWRRQCTLVGITPTEVDFGQGKAKSINNNEITTFVITTRHNHVNAIRSWQIYHRLFEKSFQMSLLAGHGAGCVEGVAVHLQRREGRRREGHRDRRPLEQVRPHAAHQVDGRRRQTLPRQDGSECLSTFPTSTASGRHRDECLLATMHSLVPYYTLVCTPWP